MMHHQLFIKLNHIKSALRIKNRLNNYYSIAITHAQPDALLQYNQTRLKTLSCSNNVILTPKISRFHTQTQPLYKDPESKAEKAANLIKENIIQTDAVKQTTAAVSAAGEKVHEVISEKKVTETAEIVEKTPLSHKSSLPLTTPASISTEVESQSGDSDKPKQVDVPRLTLWQRIVKELKHYYDGFKLLGFETKIAYGLMKKVLKGRTLTRRERKQFTRTAADLFRLVPFSVFIIVPFMEFTLPIFLKLFPNMLPSTFQEQSKEQENLKKRLKAKLEMAKFLQDTLEETSLTSTDKESKNETSLKFGEFMKKIRSKGEQPTNEDIMKYSSLFENELTLDNLTRQQLTALCQILDVSTLGNIPPNHILRFQLRMRIRNLEADDKVILKEGLDTLTVEELQQACRDRGMRAIGVSESRLRKQLEQWLDLHLNRNIPLSLLILSRALYLPENLPAEDLIKTTIAVLPKTIENATMAKIAEVTGAAIDNKTKLELLKQEDAEIKLENAATTKEAVVATAPSSPVPSSRPEPVKPATVEVDFAAQQLSKETLIDKAPVDKHEELTPIEIKEINNIIENLPTAEASQVKAEIAELKKDITEYKEDVKEVEDATSKLTETKSAKLLSKRVQKLLTDMDQLMSKIETEKATGKLETTNSVTIDELVATIKKLRGITSEAKEKKLIEVLQTLDQDKDGKIDDLNDVLKVFDLIEQENVKVTKDQLSNILSLLEKEKLIEMEESKISTEKKEVTASVSPQSVASESKKA